MNNNFNRVGFFECYQDNNCVYGALEDKNGLCVVDLTNNTGKLLYVFSDEKLSVQRLFHSIVCINNEKLLLVPFNASKFVVYDLKRKTINYIENMNTSSLGNSMFRNALEINNDIYVFGDAEKKIIKIDMDKLEAELVLELKEPFFFDAETVFASGYGIYGGNVYIPLGCSSSLFVFDIYDINKHRIINLDLPFDRMGGVSQEGEVLWIVGRGGEDNYLVKYNIKNNSVKLFEIPKSEHRTDYPYWNPICTNDRIFIFPLLESKAYVFEKDREKMRELVSVSNLIDFHQAYSQFATMGLRQSGENISFILGKNFQWYDISLCDESLSMRKIQFDIDDENYRKKYSNEIYVNSISDNEIIMESRLPLDLFIGEVVGNEI